MPEPYDKLVRNQALFREVNERVESLTSGRLTSEDGSTEFLCECSDLDCTQTIALSVEEYERVRSQSNWFVIKAGHEIPEIERVVGENNGYAVVEKFKETEYVERVDPRRRAAR